MLHFVSSESLPQGLENSLERKLETRKLGSLSDELRSLSMTNFSQAEKWLEEIYGDDFLIPAAGGADWSKLRQQLEELSGKRNGILHRGGETKAGRFIEVDMDMLNGLRVRAERFGNSLGPWLVDWWDQKARNTEGLADKIAQVLSVS